ncbi:MAG: hypothetical protein HY751_01015 [Nitrospinae bacterium]|nr:hypothetical protein [Nitrospinota bacterium]
MRRAFFLKSLGLIGLGIVGARLGLKPEKEAVDNVICGPGMSVSPSDSLNKKKDILEERLGMKSGAGTLY